MIVECYKCETPIQMLTNGEHPICEDCYEIFENWLARELSILDSAVGKRY